MQNIFQTAHIIPVLTINESYTAIKIANALIDGGINAIEVVLRTPHALEAVKQIVNHFPTCQIGAGTVLSITQMEAAMAAGAKFIVSPGFNLELVHYAHEKKINYLPGVMTPSEIMLAIQNQLHYVKLFPANLAGGINALKAYSAVFPQIKFCPTGGINLTNLADYLRLNNVAAIGGSWLVPQELIKNQDWAGITQIARQSLELMEK